jgi:hypothetical protein
MAKRPNDKERGGDRDARYHSREDFGAMSPTGART